MKDMTEGSESRHIIAFTIPLLIGNLFQQFYNIADTIIVGRFLGKEALAAVGASFPIMFFLIALIMGITMGATILISQFYGAKKYDLVKKVIDTTYIFLFFTAIVFTFAGIFLAEPLLKLLKTPEDIMHLAKTYIVIIFIGCISMFGYNSISGVLRGLGDSKTPLYFLIIATFINVCLDLLFILVYKMGVAGAAWATIVSQLVSFVLGLIYLSYSKHQFLSLKVKEMKFDCVLFKKSIAIGLPSAVQQILVSIGMMALTRIVNGFGTVVLAGYTAASRIDSVAMLPAMNFSMALSTFVGQNLGAGKPLRIKRGLRASLIMALIVSIIITILSVAFRYNFIAFFNQEAGVIQVGAEYLLIVSLFYFSFTTMFIFNGVMRGAGDTIIPMFITLLSLWFIRIPVSAILSTRMGPAGIWWGIPIAWIVGMTLSIMYYLKGNWKKKSIIIMKNE